MTEEELVDENLVELDPILEPVTFEDRQRALVARMQAEPEIRDYVLAGTYLFLQDFDAAMQMMQKMGGPGGIMKMMFAGKFKGKDEDND